MLNPLRSNVTCVHRSVALEFQEVLGMFNRLLQHVSHPSYSNTKAHPARDSYIDFVSKSSDVEAGDNLCIINHLILTRRLQLPCKDLPIQSTRVTEAAAICNEAQSDRTGSSLPSNVSQQHTIKEKMTANIVSLPMSGSTPNRSHGGCLGLPSVQYVQA